MIGTINLDITKQLNDVISKDVKPLIDPKLPFLKGLIIDWVDKDDENFLYQAKVIDHYVRKKIPIAIYDRFMSITNKEYKWLSKFSVTFFEPVINHRQGFYYLPQWQDFNSDFLEMDHTRPIDLAYKGNEINHIQKYYKDFKNYFPDYNVVYDDFDWKDVKFYVAIDSFNSYGMGYLSENVFEAMKNGCMVLLPYEHKYFHSMFEQDIVGTFRMMELFLKNFTQTMREDSIMGVYSQIQKYYNEFTIDNAVNMLKGVF